MQAGREGHTHKPRDAGDCSHHQKLGEEHREDTPCSLQRDQPGCSSFSGSSLQTVREQLSFILTPRLWSFLTAAIGHTYSRDKAAQRLPWGPTEEVAEHGACRGALPARLLRSTCPWGQAKAPPDTESGRQGNLLLLDTLPTVQPWHFSGTVNMCPPSCHPLTPMLTRTRADAPVPGNDLSKTSWPPTLSQYHPVTLLNPLARGQHIHVARPSLGSIFTPQLPPDGHRALGAPGRGEVGSRVWAEGASPLHQSAGHDESYHGDDSAFRHCRSTVSMSSCLPMSCSYALKSGCLEARPLLAQGQGFPQPCLLDGVFVC